MRRLLSILTFCTLATLAISAFAQTTVIGRTTVLGAAGTTILTASSATGGIALISHTCLYGEDCDSSIVTTGATLLVAQCVATSVSAPTDTLGNTFSTAFATPYTLDGWEYQYYYVSSPVTGSDSWTMPRGESCTFSTWSGTKTSGVVDTGAQNGTGYTSSGTTSYHAGAVTPSQTNELLLLLVQTAGSSVHPLTIDNSCTTLDDASGYAPFIEGAYCIPSSASSINPTWTAATSSADGGASIAGFEHP
ncbi:MAG: hypothetical protein ACRD4X_10890 [Candidatus Acidiferrales bacterium]